MIRGFPGSCRKLLPRRQKWGAVPWMVLFAILLGFLPCGRVWAKNPLTSYFSRLLDESRAEIDMGNFLLSAFVSQTGSPTAIVENTELTALGTTLAQRSQRAALPYRVFILESKIPWEIPFPGGPIILTSGMLSLADTPAARDFLVARNIAAISLRLPMGVIKGEALYSRILRLLKQPPQKRDSIQVRSVLRDYIKATGSIDQVKADREGILLSGNPPRTCTGALGFLKNLSEVVWPFMPWELFDLPTRIQALEGAKF